MTDLETNEQLSANILVSRQFLKNTCSPSFYPSFESTVQTSKLQDLVNRSKMARCRGRFVCPVILYNGKVTILSPQLNFPCSICNIAAL